MKTITWIGLLSLVILAGSALAEQSVEQEKSAPPSGTMQGMMGEQKSGETGMQGIGLLGVLITDRFSRVWSAEGNSRVYKLAPESVLAPDIRRASAEVREAYRFAVANQEVLRYIPCYCGCGSEGHTSNASCYL